MPPTPASSRRARSVAAPKGSGHGAAQQTGAASEHGACGRIGGSGGRVEGRASGGSPPSGHAKTAPQPSTLGYLRLGARKSHSRTTLRECAVTATTSWVYKRKRRRAYICIDEHNCIYMMTTAIYWYIQLSIYICKGLAAGAGWGTWDNTLSCSAMRLGLAAAALDKKLVLPALSAAAAKKPLTHSKAAEGVVLGTASPSCQPFTPTTTTTAHTSITPADKAQQRARTRGFLNRGSRPLGARCRCHTSTAPAGRTGRAARTRGFRNRGSRRTTRRPHQHNTSIVTFDYISSVTF